METTALESLSVEQRPAPARLRMTFDEFLKWEHTGIAECVNGEVSQMAVKNDHQRIAGFLNCLIGLYAQLIKLGVVRGARYVMRPLPEGPAREPDLMFVASEHLSRLTSDQLSGPADLVIEVVSEESTARSQREVR